MRSEGSDYRDTVRSVQSDGDDRRLAWPTTSLIGRDRELDHVSALLDDPATRIVTITGPGGVGKSRLALSAAWQAAPHFADSTVFIPLAAVETPGDVASEITRSLDLAEATGQPTSERLISGLRTRHQLLVLDNFEHLVGAAPLVAEIADRCPQIMVVVTSRRRLGLPGEQIVDLAGLTLPGPGAALGITATADAPAVRLFVERAAAVQNGFAPDQQALASIAELCRLVDGLPLAIELLASYVRLMPVDALVERLSHNASALGLDQAIAWSYGLLSPAAAKLLPRLSVFSDGCALDAIEAVCFEGDEESRMLDALLELVDLHLVEPTSMRDGGVRFGMLETVSRFADDRLRSDPERERLFDRHARYFQRLAVQCGADYASPNVVAAIGTIHRELPNIRIALDRLESTQQWTDAAEAIFGLCGYWSDHGPIDEAHGWVSRIVAAVPDDALWSARAQAWQVWIEFLRGLDLPASASDDTNRTGWLARLAAARMVMAEHADWVSWARAGWHHSIISNYAGGDEVEALVNEILERLADSTERQAVWVRPDVLTFWGQVLLDRGHADRARQAFEDAMEFARQLEHQGALCRALALYAWFSNDHARALVELEPVFAIGIDIGDRRGAAITAGALGLLSYLVGEPNRAAMWFRREIDLGLDVNWPLEVVRGMAGLVVTASQVDRHIDAAYLHGALTPRFERMQRGATRPKLDLYLSIVSATAETLGDRFDAEADRGRQVSWDVAVDHARSVADEIAQQSAAIPRPTRRRGPRANPELTDREIDVLAELIAGSTNQQIGTALGISAKTVMHHTMSVYRKLGVRGRAEAVAHALRTGLVNA